MNEIRAIIDAAYIQGFLGFAGAVIGAMCLIISIRIAAKDTILQIKLEKVAESKRDQYIALTDSYTKFLTSSLILKSRKNEEENDENWYQHLAKYIELVGSINKVNLITTSEIRLELSKLENVIVLYQTSVSNYYFNNYPLATSHELEELVFDFAKLLRSDLGIENNIAIEDELLKLRKE